VDSRRRQAKKKRTSKEDMAQNIPGSSSVNLVQNVGGRPVQGVLGQNALVGSKGEAPVGGLEDEVPQKLKQFEFLYAF